MSDYATNTSVNLTVNGQQAAETLANLKKHALELSEQIARAAAAGDKLTLQKLRKELKDTNRQIKEMESSTMQVDNPEGVAENAPDAQQTVGLYGAWL